MRIRHLLAVCLLLVTVCWAGPVLGEVEYLAVFMEGKKVGHAILTREVTEQKVTTTEQVSITISRADIPVTMNMTETSIETVDGKPLAFESVQDISIMTMKMSGTVDKAGKVTVTTSAMGAEEKKTFDWPSGAVMAEGLRLLQKKKGLKEGMNYTAKVFSPGMMQALDVRVTVGAKETVDLLGRVVELTKVETAMSVPGAGEMVSTGYVDQDLRAQKSTVPVGGMLVEMVACTKEFALSANDVLDVIDKMFIKSPQPLANVRSAKSIAYYLTPTNETAELKIPSTDNQAVSTNLGDAGGIVVTVEPVGASGGAKFPYKGKDEKILEALKSNRYLQSDDKRIIELARKAVGGTKDAAGAVKKIEAFVAKYMENKGLSVGYASAVEVASSKQGDCSEFAVLTAALCRAVGIPAQVVVGVAYVKEFAGLEDRFGGHAWTQAYVEDKWVGLDAAFKSAGLGGYGPGHITLAVGNGEPADFFNLVSTMGQFKIDKVVVNKAK
jgi:hypothetical protein